MQSIAADNTQSLLPVNTLVPLDLASALDAQERLATSFAVAARNAKTQKQLRALGAAYRRAVVGLDGFVNAILAGAQ